MGCDVGSNLLVENAVCNFDLCHSALINMGLYMVKKISCKITLRKFESGLDIPWLDVFLAPATEMEEAVWISYLRY